MPHAPHRILAVALPLALLLALALASSPALAQYKWKDSRGQIHISDQPPPRDIPDKDVLQRPKPRRLSSNEAPGPASAAASAPTARLTMMPSERNDPELEQRRSRAEAELKAQAKADEARAAEIRADNCRRARQHLATLSAGTRLVRTNEKGERMVIDDQLRASEMAQARGVMASDCR